MTLTLEIPPEVEAQIERAAAVFQTDVQAFIVAAAVEKAAAVFDEKKFDVLLKTDPMQALDYLLEVTPASTTPLGDDAIEAAYCDREDAQL